MASVPSSESEAGRTDHVAQGVALTCSLSIAPAAFETSYWSWRTSRDLVLTDLACTFYSWSCVLSSLGSSGTLFYGPGCYLRIMWLALLTLQACIILFWRRLYVQYRLPVVFLSKLLESVSYLYLLHRPTSSRNSGSWQLPPFLLAVLIRSSAQAFLRVLPFRWQMPLQALQLLIAVAQLFRLRKDLHFWEDVLASQADTAATVLDSFLHAMTGWSLPGALTPAKQCPAGQLQALVLAAVVICSSVLPLLLLYGWEACSKAKFLSMLAQQQGWRLVVSGSFGNLVRAVAHTRRASSSSSINSSSSSNHSNVSDSHSSCGISGISNSSRSSSEKSGSTQAEQLQFDPTPLFGWGFLLFLAVWGFISQVVLHSIYWQEFV